MGLLTTPRLFRLVIPLLLFIGVSGTASASSPIVCASGAANTVISNFSLSACGVPVDKPVYIELMAFSTNNAATIQLNEGLLSCQASVKNQEYSCAVTVWDGVLDRFSVSGSPANYRLMAYPSEFTSLASYQTYTATLPSGSILTLERRLSYSDVFITSLLIFLSLMVVMGIIILAVRFRQ